MASHLVPFEPCFTDNFVVATVFEEKEPHTGLLVGLQCSDTMLQQFQFFFPIVNVVAFRMIFFGRLHKCLVERGGDTFFPAPQHHQAVVLGHHMDPASELADFVLDQFFGQLQVDVHGGVLAFFRVGQILEAHTEDKVGIAQEELFNMPGITGVAIGGYQFGIAGGVRSDGFDECQFGYRLVKKYLDALIEQLCVHQLVLHARLFFVEAAQPEKPGGIALVDGDFEMSG